GRHRGCVHHRCPGGRTQVLPPPRRMRTPPAARPWLCPDVPSCPTRRIRTHEELPKRGGGRTCGVREVHDPHTHFSHFLLQEQPFDGPFPVIALEDHIERVLSPCHALVLVMVRHRPVHQAQG